MNASALFEKERRPSRGGQGRAAIRQVQPPKFHEL